MEHPTLTEKGTTMSKVQESVVMAAYAEDKIRERLKPLLEAQTADQVAEFLRSNPHGKVYNGIREDSAHCPIANFVRDHTQWLPEGTYPEVEDDIRIPIPDVWLDDEAREHDWWEFTSNGISDFIKEFDAGEYPDLAVG